jgi:AraC-like DNA-binding protein/mannose-6-phosphate isomerase-like protein (cupin superfamily)
MFASPSFIHYGSPSELYVEYVKRTEPYTMDIEHYHSYYEIYYLLSGSRIYFIEDRSYSVEQGDLVFIGKEMLHRTMQAGDSAHERVIVHCTDEWLRGLGPGLDVLFDRLFQADIRVLRLPRQESLLAESAVRAMRDEAEAREPGYHVAIRHAVAGLLLLCGRYAAKHQPEPFRHVSPLHAKISEIVRYINGHYDEPLRLADLSERFFISPHYLSRMFKEVTGFVYTDYVVLTRVKEAQRLLRETELSVSGVAEKVGFDNFSHFGKTFKKVTSMSPREYRKSMS